MSSTSTLSPANYLMTFICLAMGDPLEKEDMGMIQRRRQGKKKKKNGQVRGAGR